jgi:ribonucleoside-triphosphate reductase
MQQFTKDAEKVVKGSVKDGTVYYTNSTYLNVAYQMNPIDRVKQEGKFHDMIEAGALTHIWLADSHPRASSIANFVVKSFRQTRNAQIAFSPEFTTCNSCGKVYRGLKDECPNCSRKTYEGIKKIK